MLSIKGESTDTMALLPQLLVIENSFLVFFDMSISISSSTKDFKAVLNRPGYS